MPKHPEYATSTTLIKPLRVQCTTAIDILSQLKPALRDQKLAEQAAIKQQAAQEQKATVERLTNWVKEQEVADEQARMEAARVERMKQIQLAEAQRIYERSKNPNGPFVAPPAIPTRAPVPSLVEPPRVHAPDTLPVPQPVPMPIPPSPYTSESGAALRELLIPSSIVSLFLDLSAANTQRNLEFCGVLAGQLSHNRFTLTHLIIPKQSSTSDTCSMESEEEVLLAQDSADLLTLGWIHTHPTQDCFLSSVDLHTHFGYQLMLPEAVAIVVAPTKRPNYGVFRLTDPPGLGCIGECPQRGFHQHSCPGPIYRDIDRGHAQLVDGLPLKVIDLR